MVLAQADQHLQCSQLRLISISSVKILSVFKLHGKSVMVQSKVMLCEYETLGYLR